MFFIFHYITPWLMHCKSSFWSLVDVDVSAILNPKFVITFNVSNFYKLLCFAHIFERNVEKEKHGLNFAVVSDSSSVEYLCVNNWLLCVVLSGLCEWKVKLAHVNLLINSFHPVITSGTNNNSVCSIITYYNTWTLSGGTLFFHFICYSLYTEDEDWKN